ncbi:MAG: T9SS type A sorting domain-containing protein [Salinivirgaceae bacterium]|jgi:hypothetical protein
MVRFYLSMVLLGFLFPCMAQQQSLLSTAGGFYQNSEISVSWSLGESVTETFGSGNYTVTQGFQQSKLNPVVIDEPKDPFSSAIDVFPNPTQGLVYINIKKEPALPPDLPDRFTLYNIQGKQLEQGILKEEQTMLDLGKYSGAVYYLRFFNLDTNTQTTVIIQKIN